MSDVLETLVYLADLNAEEVRSRRRSMQPSLSDAQLAVKMEEAEWNSFLEKIHKAEQPAVVDGLEDEDEDEIEQLRSAIGVLREAAQPLTVFEVVRGLQKRDVLTRRFPAAARQAAVAMLEKLRRAERVTVDGNGGWSLR